MEPPQFINDRIRRERLNNINKGPVLVSSNDHIEPSDDDTVIEQGDEGNYSIQTVPTGEQNPMVMAGELASQLWSNYKWPIIAGGAFAVWFFFIRKRY